MSSKITFKSVLTGVQLVFKQRITSIEIDRSFKNLTQTAKIVMPRYAELLSPGEPNYKIRTGDSVIIQLGFDGAYNTEFEGYVSLVKPNIPLEIECEDEMWKYKQITINKAWQSITLKALISYLVPGTDTALVPDITLSPFRLERVSVAKALEKLKDYGVVIYFRHKKLFVGFAYFDTNVDLVKYHFQENTPPPDGLEFRKADDAKIKVKAISMLRNNTKLEVEVGDEDGNTTTLNYYNIGSKEELKQIAEQQLPLLKRDGLTGSFKAFGNPFCDHGWTAQLKDDWYPERAGNYFIDAVKVTYDDTNGYIRTITPGRRASA